MSVKILTALKVLLFLSMALCFTLQILDSIEKYVSGKTSISESQMKKDKEALPSFSICAEPSFDVAFMKQYNMSPNFFLESYRISFLNTDFEFPKNLGFYSNSSITLQKYWKSSAIQPDIFEIGGDTSRNPSNTYSEIKSWEQINSLSFGACQSFVLKKKRGADEILLLGFVYPW